MTRANEHVRRRASSFGLVRNDGAKRRLGAMAVKKDRWLIEERGIGPDEPRIDGRVDKTDVRSSGKLRKGGRFDFGVAVGHCRRHGKTVLPGFFTDPVERDRRPGVRRDLVAEKSDSRIPRRHLPASHRLVAEFPRRIDHPLPGLRRQSSAFGEIKNKRNAGLGNLRFVRDIHHCRPSRERRFPRRANPSRAALSHV